MAVVQKVKESLKTSILSKRRERGEGEIKVEFKECKKYELSREDLAKRDKRRKQNREAARRFRIKKKLSTSGNLKQLQKYSIQNLQLETEIKQLLREKTALKEIVQKHIHSDKCVFLSQSGNPRAAACQTEQPEMIPFANRDIPASEGQSSLTGQEQGIAYSNWADKDPGFERTQFIGQQPLVTCSGNEDDSDPIIERPKQICRQLSIPSDALANLEHLLTDINSSTLLPFESNSNLFEEEDHSESTSSPPASAGFQVMSSASSTDEGTFFGYDYTVPVKNNEWPVKPEDSAQCGHGVIPLADEDFSNGFDCGLSNNALPHFQQLFDFNVTEEDSNKDYMNL